MCVTCTVGKLHVNACTYDAYACKKLLTCTGVDEHGRISDTDSNEL